MSASTFSRSLGTAAALASVSAVLGTIAASPATTDARGQQAGIRGSAFVTQVFAPCQLMLCSSPYRATIMIYRMAQRRELVVIHSNSRGRFHVPLAPGRYFLRPEPQLSCAGAVIPQRKRIAVRVHRTTYSTVNIEYQSFPVAC